MARTRLLAGLWLVVLAAVLAVTVRWRAEPPPASGAAPDALAPPEVAAPPAPPPQLAPEAPRKAALPAWLAGLLDPDPARDTSAAALGSATGRVAWREGGLPVVGVRVRLVAAPHDTVLPEPGEPEVDGFVDLATPAPTDLLGRFTLDGVAPRANQFLRLELPDGSIEAHELRAIPRHGLESWQGEFLIDPRGGIAGAVVDADGKPIPDAVVRAVYEQRFDAAAVPEETREGRLAGAETLRASGTERGRPLRASALARQRMLVFPSARTDGEGRFRFDAVREGVVSLLIQQRELIGRRVDVPVAGGKTTDVGSLQLAGGDAFTVRVVDAERRPVAGVAVGVCTFGSRYGPEPERTDSKGLAVFPLDWLDPEARTGGNDRVMVYVGNGPGEPWSFAGAFPRPGIQIERGARSEREVVVATADGSALPTVRFQTQPKLPGLSWSATETGYVLRGLPPGVAVVLLAGADGFAPAVARIGSEGLTTRPLDGRDFGRLPMPSDRRPIGPVELTLVPAFPVEVAVVDGAGQPIEGARVAFSALPDHRSQRVPGTDWPTAVRDMALGSTATNGLLAAAGLWDTRCAFTVSHPELGVVTVVRPTLVPGERVVVTLLRPGRIAGLLLDHGEVVARRYRVHLEPVQITRDEPLREAIDTVSNDEGRFELPRIEPGRWQLEVSEPRLPDAGNARRLRDLARPRVHAQRELTLDPGVDLHLSIDVEAAESRASGVVRVGGVPEAGVRVELWSVDARPKGERGATSVSVVATDLLGRFRVPRERAHGTELRVAVRRAGLFVPVATVPLRDDRSGHHGIAVDVPVGDLVLCLRHADGMPLANRPVALAAADGTRVTAVADADGIVRELRLPARSYRVEAVDALDRPLEFGPEVPVVAGTLTIQERLAR